MKIKTIKNKKAASRITMNISSLSGTTSINANTDVVLDNDITIDSTSEYLDLIGDNITIDGKGHTITVEAADYLGFIKNGSSGATAPCKNCTIKNIHVVAIGGGSVANQGGWIGQSLFGKGINGGSILVENCSSSGDISSEGGGILGKWIGFNQKSLSTITVSNCYSIGNISGNYGGGILGEQAGSSQNNSTITVNNCYSTGAISGIGVGGILGKAAGKDQFNSTVTVNNCYTIGNITGTDAGGIFGVSKHANSTDSNCIFVEGASSGFFAADAQTAGTWIDANAASTIGTSTTNNDVTDVWANKSSGSAWIHAVFGCTDSSAFNYDTTANTDDGNCTDKVVGCMDYNALNYDSNANTDDSSCIYTGCTDSNAFNYDNTANTDDGSCIDKVFGCTNDIYPNYDPNVNTDDGTCYKKMEVDNSTFSSSAINIYANTDVVLTEDITIDNINEYLDLQGDNITIDGKGYTITVTTANYTGFIKNGGFNTNALCANCTIKNINVAASGSGSLASNGGWIGKKRFAKNIDDGNILFNNCYSTGDIGNYGGGISGDYTGQLMNSSTITFNNCYSTGAIGSQGGGISGRYTGEDMTSSNVIANNCYTIGTIGSNAGGIYGQTSTATHYNCIYTNGKSDDITVAVAQTENTWEDANAVITIGTSTANNDVTDVWTNKSSGSPWTHRLAVPGCTDVNALNYNSNANTDDGNCVDKVLGCIDVNALNYNSNANTDDETCEHIQLDQINDGNLVGFSGSKSQWQSFTVGKKGILYELQCKMRNPLGSGANESDVKLSLYSGEGIEGTLLAESSELKTPKSGQDWVIFNVSNLNIFVNIGQEYTIRIEVPSESPEAFLPFNMNRYGRGKSQTYVDFFFKTFIMNTDLEPGCNDPDALNYDSSAGINNGTCTYPEAVGVQPEAGGVQPEPVTGVINFCNDPDACNYLEEGDCKELDCAGICGGEAEKIGKDCILSYKM